ncbi:ParM/StbA family protein [Anabaena sp. CCY 9402-a]|uniref:ParM/StbA family protein n=1 Tax=Anabaena sp. CCY 9402-a TaxID=3103867 RepID=UPI0039C5D382
MNTFNPNNDNGKITHINAHYETTISHIDKKTILSIDLGGSFTKACVMCDPENVVFIPSNVKPISVEDIENGVFESRPTDHPLLNLWIEHQGSGYAMGQLAADYGANFGIGQSKLEDALVKVLTVAGYFKLKDEISVVMSLPFFSPQQFESEKAQLINIITGNHFIKFCDSAVDLNISKVWIIPEGYGSFLWLGCQRIKRSGNPDFTKAPLAVVDIGHQNINLLIVDNFKCVRDACKSEEFGMSKFYEIIAAEIKGADTPLLDLIAAVKKPNSKGLYLPKCANKLTKIDDSLPNLIEQFARETCSRLFAWLPEKVTDVIITGGGGEFYWEYVQRLLKEANINTYLAKPSCLANALGQYIYGYSNIKN